MDKGSQREGIGLVVLSLIVLAVSGTLLLVFGPDDVIPGRGLVGAWAFGTAAIAVGVGTYGVIKLLRGRNR